MTYLCKVPLNPLRSGCQRLLASPQRVHAAVEGVLPPGHGRLLWRLERSGPAVDLIVQSPERPSLQHLVEQAGWSDSPSGAPVVADMEPLFKQLAIGREFQFRARLNPTHAARSGGDASPTVRRGHRTANHQLSWFLARAAGGARQWGFTVGETDDPRVAVIERDRLSFGRAKGTPPVVLNTSLYQGVLQVTDVALLRRTIEHGIGHGKAYGCGLLTLGPVD